MFAFFDLQNFIATTCYGLSPAHYNSVDEQSVTSSCFPSALLLLPSGWCGKVANVAHSFKNGKITSLLMLTNQGLASPNLSGSCEKFAQERLLPFGLTFLWNA